MGEKYFDEVVKNTIMNQFSVPEAGVNAKLTYVNRRISCLLAGVSNRRNFQKYCKLV